MCLGAVELGQDNKSLLHRVDVCDFTELRAYEESREGIGNGVELGMYRIDL